MKAYYVYNKAFLCPITEEELRQILAREQVLRQEEKEDDGKDWPFDDYDVRHLQPTPNYED